MPDFLQGKVAVVTGAGRGIGRAVALLMAQEGARVVVADPGVSLNGGEASSRPADEVVAEIKSHGGEAVSCYESVATMQGGERIVQCGLDSFGHLDIVAACHGILRDRMIFNMSEEEWDAVINVHLKGTFAVVKPACARFREQRSGRIITISSESGLVGNPGQANYGAAKSGIGGFTKVVARDMGRYGVTANAIVPRAWTRMTENVPEAAKQQGAGIPSREEFQQWLPEDIAPFATYLATDYASSINGQMFLVYGGTVALLSQPRPVRTVYKGDGLWTVDELASLLPDTLCKDLVNPAPPR